MSLRTEIQTKIVSALMAASYPTVTYNPTTKLPSTGGSLAPASIVCNEVGGRLELAGGHGDGYVLKDWRFETVLEFNKEVDVTEALMGLSLSFADGNYAVIIGLDSNYRPEHPVSQGPSKGTKVSLVFIANVKK